MKKFVLLAVMSVLVLAGCKKFFIDEDTQIRKRKFEKLLLNKEWKYTYIKGDSTGLSTGQNSPSYAESSYRYAFNGTIKFLDNGDFIHNGMYYGTYIIQYGTPRIDIRKGDGVSSSIQIGSYGIYEIVDGRLEIGLTNSSAVVYNN